MLVHLNMDYEVRDPQHAWSYNGFRVNNSKGREIAVFNSGDPILDHQLCRIWGRRMALEFEDFMVLEGSSITHFFFDVPGYRMIDDGDGEVMVIEDRPGYADDPVYLP